MEDSPGETDSFICCIVAVHGLNGDSRRTWTDKDSGRLWLKDFLPSVVPTARIFTFGYNSGIVFSRSVSGLDIFSRELLNALKLKRPSPEAQKRPLLFICHSMGGIVVKKALILAHEARNFYGDILDSTVGIVFFGTPHRGSDLASWGKILSRIVNTATLSKSLRSSLLKEMEINSNVLRSVSQQFIQRAKPLQIVSVTEQYITPPLSTLVVQEDSAVMGIPNELVVPVNSDHQSMCRFPEPTSQGYLLVENAIRDMIGNVPQDLGSVFGPGLLPEQPTISIPQRRQALDSPVPGQALGTMASPMSGDDEELDKFWTSMSDRTQETPGVLALSPNSPSYDTRKLSPLPVAVSSNHSTFTDSLGTIYRSPLALVEPKKEKPVARFETSEKHLGKISHGLSIVRLRIGGLRRKEISEDKSRHDQTFQLEMASGQNLDDLSKTLEAQGFKPSKFKFVRTSQQTFARQEIAYGRSNAIIDTWVDIFTKPVTVTSRPSCYKQSLGLKINEQETLASFFSRVYPYSLDIQLTGGDFRNEPSTTVLVNRGKMKQVAIELMRTLRMPVDGKVHPLPPGLGRFPLYNVEEFKERLPPSIAAQGGVFFPMYQREAMWISFKCNKKKLVVRPFVGGINGISGESMIGNMTTLIRKLNNLAPKQDYLTLPDQPWLDGVAASPGQVKQFIAVAMPSPKITKSTETTDNDGEGNARYRLPETAGKSVEYQVTGKDEVGGIQLEIIPEHAISSMSFSRKPNYFVRREYDQDDELTKYKPFEEQALNERTGLRNTSHCLEVLKTPAELALNEGDLIHIKNLRLIKPNRPKILDDLLEEDQCTEDVVSLEADYGTSIDCSQGDPDLTRRGGRPIPFDACLNISVPGQKQLVLEVDSLDSFDAMINYLDSKYPSERQQSLCIWKLVANDLERKFEVRSWEECWRFWKSIASTRLDTGIKVQFEMTWADSVEQINSILYRVDQKRLEPDEQFWDGRSFLITSEAEDPKILMDTIRKTSGVLLPGAWAVISESSASNLTSCTVVKNVSITTTVEIRFFVSTLTGKTCAVRFDPSHTVYQLKLLLEALEGIPIDKQRLIFAGKALEDERTLTSHNIEQYSRIVLVLRLRGGGGIEIELSNGERFVPHVTSESTVADLKEEIQNKTGIVSSKQVLMYGGRPLKDFEFVHSLHGGTIYLDLRASATLTVAAGGTIKQDIAEDKNNPRIWDVANSKLLSIQIVNAANFEEITGFLAPPTPISVHTYAQQQMPFFDIYNETPSLVGGAFGKIQSVADQPTVKPCVSCAKAPVCILRPCNHYYCRNCVVTMQRTLKCRHCLRPFQRAVTLTPPAKPLETRVVLLEMGAERPPFKSVVEDGQSVSLSDPEEE